MVKAIVAQSQYQFSSTKTHEQTQASKPINQWIEKMQKEISNHEVNPLKHRKLSLSQHIMKADNYYGREDTKKIKMEEFVMDVEFKFGFPMLILDIIQAFTGYDIIQLIRNEYEPKRPIQRLEPDNKDFENFKSKI